MLRLCRSSLGLCLRSRRIERWDIGSGVLLKVSICQFWSDPIDAQLGCLVVGVCYP